MSNPTAYLRSSYLNDPDAIRDFMERHVVFRVKFRKKDGTIRHLLGTVEPGFLGVNTPNGTGKPNYDEAIPVFDMEKQEWRAFKPDNLIELHSV
jgi:hypothetical protein